jgi:asparagine synthetase B (glutamine-hydrolysing)
MLERERQVERDGRNAFNGRAWAETKGSIVNPLIPRVAAAFSALGLEHGVEPRAPLFDRRIVEFSLARPRGERASMGGVKHLLRRAADGLLPASVLLPRPRKTGVLSGYFARSLREDREGSVTRAFTDPVLAQLNIIDADALKRAWTDYRAGVGPGSDRGGQLFTAFQTELWLRARTAVGQVAGPSAVPRLSAPAAGFVQ